MTSTPMATVEAAADLNTMMPFVFLGLLSRFQTRRGRTTACLTDALDSRFGTRCPSRRAQAARRVEPCVAALPSRHSAAAVCARTTSSIDGCASSGAVQEQRVRYFAADVGSVAAPRSMLPCRTVATRGSPPVSRVAERRLRVAAARAPLRTSVLASSSSTSSWPREDSWGPDSGVTTATGGGGGGRAGVPASSSGAAPAAAGASASP